MTNASLVGVDLGTSSVKVVVTDPEGQALGTATRPYAVESPNAGWTESDPRAWWRETVTAVRDAVAEARSGGAGSPSALGLSGQMHGVVLVDAQLEPVRPAILWADIRAAEVMRAYEGLAAESMTRLANPVIPGTRRPDPPLAEQVRAVRDGHRPLGAPAEGLAAGTNDRGGPYRTE